MEPAALRRRLPPKVLCVNDDGIDAPGFLKMVEKISKICEVYVAAPDRERSATSHCITINEPLEARPASVPGAKVAFAVSGSPADCTMLALSGALFGPSDSSFALCVSGINRGNNAGLHVVYSGTVAAAREAACKGLPAMAVSLDSHSRSADYEAAATVTVLLADAFLACRSSSDPLTSAGFLAGLVVNVNVPDALDAGALRGFRVTHQSLECTQPRFVEDAGADGDGSRPAGLGAGAGCRVFRNLAGQAPPDRTPGTDTWAMAEGFVSITLLSLLSSAPPPGPPVAGGAAAAGEAGAAERGGLGPMGREAAQGLFESLRGIVAAQKAPTVAAAPATAAEAA